MHVVNSAIFFVFSFLLRRSKGSAEKSILCDYVMMDFYDCFWINQQEKSG